VKPWFRPLAGADDGDVLYVLEGIIEVEILAPLDTLHGNPRSLDWMMAMLPVVSPLGASILELCITSRNQRMVLWQSGAVSFALMWASIGGVAQQGGRMSLHARRAATLSSVTRLQKVRQGCVGPCPGDWLAENDGGDFCSMGMRCMPRVC
jgi:hypothetical protein